MSIEAMKMALAKLDHLWEIAVDERMGTDVLPEIKALHQAIEQAENHEWVGLTDEDIYSIIESNVPPKLTTLFEIAAWVAKVVEARLKEKNGG